MRSEASPDSISWTWFATRPLSTLMKNPATKPNRKDGAVEHALPDPWREALAEFDRSLKARGMAEKTRRAYGQDLGELSQWAARADVSKGEVGHRLLRRYA